MRVPSWYRRYHAWATEDGGSRGTWLGLTVGAVIGGAFGFAFNLVRLFAGDEIAYAVFLDVLGWMMLVGLPIAALDAWAGGVMRGQRVAPWVRLVVLTGVGVIGGSYLLFNF